MRRPERAPQFPDVGTHARDHRRRRAEWSLVGGLAATSLILGYIGFADVFPGRPRSEFLYKSLQLFVLESGSINERSVPWTLEIARVLAPAVAAYAAVRTVFVLFRDQLQAVVIRRFRGHVVVAGLGRKGFTLAKSLQAAGWRVLVVERDTGNPRIASCRQRGIHVVTGDAADRVILARARVLQASYVVVTTGANETNVEVAFAARALAEDASAARGPTVHVHLDDLVLWRLLQAELIATAAASPVRIEFFNAYDAAARALLDRLSPLEAGGRGSDHHILVVGSGVLAESVVLHTARSALGIGGGRPARVRVTLAGPAASAELDALAGRHPRLREALEVESWDVDHEALSVESEAVRALDATFVVVDLENEQESLQAALTLAGQPALRRAGVVLAVDDESAGLAIALRSAGVLRHVTPFGVLSRTLTPELLTGGVNELLAQAKHQHYVECELERGATAVGNPSLVPWHLLPETLKESNRLFADSFGQKLTEAGCTLVPAPLPDTEQADFAFPEELVEQLARGEHDRWWNDLVRNGWRLGEVKDAERKLHPKLVPWEELDEDDRDKDREPVRDLPRMLARAGLAVARLDSVAKGRPDEGGVPPEAAQAVSSEPE
jgi:voltage-gated potassium channel Kch